MNGKIGNAVKNSFLVIISLIFTIAVSEGLVRIFLPKISSGWGWQNSPHRKQQPKSASTEVNQLGLRGQEIKYTEEDFVVLLIGDSQVEAAGNPFQDRPEYQLERELRKKLKRSVKVFSLGSAGWGQDQQLLATEKYFSQYRADLVLHWATPFNDFWENAFPDRSVTKEAGRMKPSYKLSPQGDLLGPFYEKNFYFQGSALLQLVLQTMMKEPLNELLLKKWVRDLPPSEVPSVSPECQNAIEVSQEKFFENIFSMNANKYTMVTNEDIKNSRSHFSLISDPETARDRYEIQLTAALFSKIKNISKSHKADYKVFYPVREDFDERTQRIQCIKSAEGILFAKKAGFQSLLKFLAPAEDLIAFPLSGKDENVVSKGDRHLGPLGNKKAMEILSEVLAASSGRKI